jgi:two-component system, NarL family, invasion response regulator UvrY
MKQDWDLVSVDINIPGRNGLEVLEEVKRLRPRTPVLVLSAYPEEEFAIRSLKLGASGYLNKSLASDEVLAAAKKPWLAANMSRLRWRKNWRHRSVAMSNKRRMKASQNRELQVLRMVASGRTIKEIAAELALSEKTIGTYRMRASRRSWAKLQCRVDALCFEASVGGLVRLFGPRARHHFALLLSVGRFTDRTFLSYLTQFRVIDHLSGGAFVASISPYEWN